MKTLSRTTFKAAGDMPNREDLPFHMSGDVGIRVWHQLAVEIEAWLILRVFGRPRR